MISGLMGSTIPLGPIREILRPHLDLILPLFFLVFFIAALFAIAFHTNPRVRKTYVSGLFVLILLVNVVGVTVPPLTHWQKFAQDYSEEETVYEIRAVDVNGNELHYDHRATLSVDGVTIFIMQKELASDLPRDEKVRRSRFLLERANDYRTRVESRSPLHYARYPPHGLDNFWTPARLEGYGEFVGIRVYELRVDTGDDGQQIEDVSEKLVWEYFRDEHTQLRKGPGNSPEANLGQIGP